MIFRNLSLCVSRLSRSPSRCVHWTFFPFGIKSSSVNILQTSCRWEERAKHALAYLDLCAHVVCTRGTPRRWAWKKSQPSNRFVRLTQRASCLCFTWCMLYVVADKLHSSDRYSIMKLKATDNSERTMYYMLLVRCISKLDLCKSNLFKYFFDISFSSILINEIFPTVTFFIRFQTS